MTTSSNDFFEPRGKGTTAAKVRGVSRVDGSGERTALFFDTPTGAVRLELFANDALWLAQAIVENQALARRSRESQPAQCQSSI